MFSVRMDNGIIIVIAFMTAAVAMKAATVGNPIPGYLLALLAAIVALFAMHQDEVRSQIVLSWGICATAILSAYVGSHVRKIRG
jgi:hypothetical protein